MDATGAKKLVILGTVGTATLTTMGYLGGHAGELPSARVAVGAFAAGIMLSVLAEGAPAVAGGLAALMFTTAAVVYGADAWAAVSKAVNRT